MGVPWSRPVGRVEVCRPPMVLDEPLEFLNRSGIVSLFDDSGVPVCLHLALSRSNDQIVSDHMMDEGNIVAFAVEGTVPEITGVEIRRRLDPQGGYKQLVVEAAQAGDEPAGVRSGEGWR